MKRRLAEGSGLSSGFVILFIVEFLLRFDGNSRLLEATFSFVVSNYLGVSGTNIICGYCTPNKALKSRRRDDFVLISYYVLRESSRLLTGAVFIVVYFFTFVI